MMHQTTAATWLSQSSVDPAVLQRWPAYRVTLLGSDDVDPEALAAVSHTLLEQAHLHARRSESSDVDPRTARWHEAYRDFGIKPRAARASVDALIRRARSDSGLPSIGTLVDLYNAISILHHVPIGGEDLDAYAGSARLILATGDEPFHTSAHGEPTIERPDPGEPVWVDDLGVTCRRWNWRQTSRTAITDATRRVGFIIDSLDAPGHDGAEAAADHLSDLLPDLTRRTIPGPAVDRA